ncbi:MAG: hypothetical protein OXB88_05255 [Bacteriovoracales bacterium]|nr:hypothetical protein [Bacteriovoracales bacterium]
MDHGLPHGLKDGGERIQWSWPFENWPGRYPHEKRKDMKKDLVMLFLGLSAALLFFFLVLYFKTDLFSSANLHPNLFQWRNNLNPLGHLHTRDVFLTVYGTVYYIKPFY